MTPFPPLFLLIARKASCAPRRPWVSSRISMSANNQNVAPPQYIRPQGMGVIQTKVARQRLSFRHAFEGPSPNHGRIELSRLRTGDRLDIGAIAFRRPFASLRHVGQRQMRHLMDQDPIVPKGSFASHATDADTDRRAREAVGGPGADPIAVIGDHRESDVPYRESFEVSGYRACAAPDPLHHSRVIEARRTVREDYRDLAFADGQVRGRPPREIPRPSRSRRRSGHSRCTVPCALCDGRPRFTPDRILWNQRPVRIARLDVARATLIPKFLGEGIIVDVELAVNDCPLTGIGV